MLRRVEKTVINRNLKMRPFSLQKTVNFAQFNIFDKKNI